MYPEVKINIIFGIFDSKADFGRRSLERSNGFSFIFWSRTKALKNLFSRDFHVLFVTISFPEPAILLSRNQRLWDNQSHIASDWPLE